MDLNIEKNEMLSLGNVNFSHSKENDAKPFGRMFAYQIYVCIKALLHVLPIEFNASCSNPEEYDPR